jgi:hypothetical protein
MAWKGDQSWFESGRPWVGVYVCRLRAVSGGGVASIGIYKDWVFDVSCTCASFAENASALWTG